MGRVFIADVTERTIENREDFIVVKKQRVAPPDICYDTTPSVVATEIYALLHLNMLMKLKDAAILFPRRMWHHGVLFMEDEADDKAGMHFVFSMEFCGISVFDWMLTRACKARPNVPVAAENESPWLTSAGAGRFLATSPFATDVVLFNGILKALLLQVTIALAQSQKYFCFCHNDLHMGNVLFKPGGFERKMYVTGFGSFLVRQPAIALIDFQHSCMHRLDSNGHLIGMLAGVKTSVENSFSLSYDLWRFCSMLTLCGLREVWNQVHPDTQQFLWAVCRFETPLGVFPTLTNTEQWTPFMHSGFLPEQVLSWSFFDSFRVDPLRIGAVHHCIERPHRGYDACAAFERHERRYSLCASPLSVRSTLHGSNELPLMRAPLFVKHYFGSIRGHATIKAKDASPALINRFFYIKAFMLVSAMQYAAAHFETGDDAENAAIVNALLVNLYGCWDFTDRFDTSVYPTETAYYDRSRELCKTKAVKAVVCAWPQPLGAIHERMASFAMNENESMANEWLGFMHALI